MGAFTLIVYSGHETPYNIDFVRSFMNMKNRGMDQTTTFVENSLDITKINPDIIKRSLTRDEIKKYSQHTFIFNCHRNAINDNSYNAEQPFEDPIRHQTLEYPELVGRPKRMLMCNGEIYNYKELIQENKFTERDLQSNSDVEVILPMYIKYGLEETLNQLQGDYSFVLTENLNTYKTRSMNIFVVRDILGTRPLYSIKHKTLPFYMFSSEIKAIPQNVLSSNNYSITEIPPGCYWSFKNPHTFTKYHSFDSYKNIESCKYQDANPQTLEKIYNEIREKSNSSILKRVKDIDRFGVLLSGGFDSSIILSNIAEMISTKIINPKELHVFTLGKHYTSENIEEAKKVVDYLEKKYNLDIHHHIISLDNNVISMSELDNVIMHLETYAPEMIRDSIPYYFIMKYISSKTNIKVLISGDGLDEFCGYKEFNDFNDQQFQEYSIKLLENLSKFDLLRIDKIAESFGLEVRYPFLDKIFIDLMLSIHPKLKRSQQRKINEEPMEKYIVRKAFEIDFLPETTIWKRIQCLCEYCHNFETSLQTQFQELYSDSEFAYYTNSLVKDQKNIVTLPKTKEEMHYRKIFNRLFPNTDYIIPYFWEHLWSFV